MTNAFYKDNNGNYAFDTTVLEQAFKEARKIYKERGFMREMGKGIAPAITTVDMAKAWMSEGHPFTCEKSEEVCANALRVLEAARKNGIPIFHTTTGYVGDRQWDLPRWDEKIPMSALDINTHWLEIDPKLKPQPEEPVIHKKYASNFFGTHLAQTLTYLGVDTVIVMGATACACVRHTVMDSTGYGFKTIIPEGTIGDRVPGVVEWNMFDMEAKFADVLTVDEVVEYLLSIDNSVYKKPERKLDKELVTN
ncbi:isochorismatase family protein [Bacillus benzoevorans]|uniref:N-carbamoylsarcosine amidase n=1 Tax=Bacillus benzoevorans TaxID=1456 RepID=A0A7X0LX39_9BACI|nr:isochorismatase family protein [Bacillus benzoevorans]MBB6446127.1 N-carbamoylsarcosine amidase [Bacillus benzoevorans]